MGTSNYLDDWGCLNIDGTVVTQCRNEDIPSGGYVEIPEGVTEIGEWEQNVSYIRDDREYELAYEMGIELPFGDEEFRGAFQQCTNLVSVSIPDSVTSISGGAFWLCTNLTSVTIPGSVRKLDAVCRGTLRTERYVGNNQMRWRSINADLCYETSGAFSGCTGLASVTLSEGLTLIGDRTFSGCTGLVSVSIPDSVTSIGECAFQECTSLTSVTLPEGLTLIRDNTFFGCTSLERITIPKGVRRIGNGAFEDCSRLASVALPKSIKVIGKEAFKGCKKLVIYYEGSEADWRNVGYGSAFEPGTRIQYNWQGPAPVPAATQRQKPPKKPAGGTTSGSVPRQDTAQRQKPPKKPAGGGTARGAGGFDLTHMTLPDGTTEIRPYAFMGCATLESVVIPSSVTRIGENAFAGCSRLASVTFSKSVAHIGTDAFSGCPLKEVHYGGGKDEWLAITGDRPRSKGIKVNLYPKGLPS